VRKHNHIPEINSNDVNGRAKGGPSQTNGTKATSKTNTKKEVATNQKHAGKATALKGKGKWG